MPITTFPSINLETLATVTGGCKKSPPPPPQEEAAPQISTSVNITGYGAPVTAGTPPTVA